MRATFADINSGKAAGMHRHDCLDRFVRFPTDKKGSFSGAFHVCFSYRTVPALYNPVVVFFDGGESAAHGVFRHYARVHELQQVVGAAGL